MDAEQAPEDEAQAAGTRRILEVLGGLSSGPRVANLLHRLQDSRNPKIRSKAALLLGRAFQDQRRATQQLAEPDPRVRANAVEALWGASGPDWVNLFRTAAQDPHNRVRANGWLGLYHAGEIESVAGLEAMAAGSEPDRVSALWAMGHTGDPRFLPLVARTPAPTDEGGRKVHARALARLTAVDGEARSRPALDAFLHEFDARGRLSFSLARQSDSAIVRGLKALSFVVTEDTVPVSRYSVAEVRPPDTIDVAFVLPRNREFGDKLVSEGLEAAAKLHRRRDQWSVVRFADGFTARGDDVAGEVRFSPDLTGWVLATPSFRGPTAPHLIAAAQMQLPVLSVQRGARHMIVVAGFDGTQMPPDVIALRALEHELHGARVMFHAIVPSTAPIGVLLGVQSLCRSTGGWCAPNTPPDRITETLRRIAISLVHRYEVTWTSRHDAAGVALDVFAPGAYGRLDLQRNAASV
jgi:hypothetical protein